MDASNLLRNQTTGPAPAAESFLGGRDRAVKLSRFKLDFVNGFIRANNITDMVEFGCEDSALIRQLRIAKYTGVAATIAALAAGQAVTADDPSRSFYAAQNLPENTTARMALSVDMLRRIVADTEFNQHVRALFQAARDYVVVCAGNAAPSWALPAPGDKSFTCHVQRFFPSWHLAAHIPNPYPCLSTSIKPGANADFFVYARQGTHCAIPLLASP